MRIALVAIPLLVLPAWALAQQPPGYGVVESVTPVSRAPEESASAGASRPPAIERARQKRSYLVRVRMDDGSVQVRSVRRAEVRPGQRALVTNAGQVVPE